MCGAVTAWLVERVGILQWWSLQEFVEEFADIMHMQLDLRKEAVSGGPCPSLVKKPLPLGAHARAVTRSGWCAVLTVWVACVAEEP